MKLITILLMGILAFEAASLIAADKPISIFRELGSETPPANIAVSEGGRIFMSTHQAYGSEHKVVELLSDGTYRPYPDYEFEQPLTGVLGAIVDEEDILWFLTTSWGKDAMGRVIGWDTKNERLYKVFYIARPLVNEEYILNDMAVDRTNDMIYITDTAGDSTSALLVLDINTGLVRRVLEGSSATIAEDKTLMIDGKAVFMHGKEARVGVNPITIDVKNEWVYFAPMSSESIYRLKTADLVDSGLDKDELVSRVERYAYKPMGDGITIDEAGNLYVSDLPNNAIGMISTDRKYHVLYQDDQLLNWVEGFANAGKSGMYVTSNQLHKSPAFNNEKPTPSQFYILQFDPSAFASFGR